MAATRRATIVATDVPGIARVCSTDESTGPIRARAAATYRNSTVGSLSSSSSDSHATMRLARAAHCSTTADLP